jgi:tetratricopeptide (TPR) repeat protein
MALVLLLALLWQAAEDPYQKGLILLKQNAIAEAAQALEEAARQNPAWPFVWLAMADVRLRQGRFREAEQNEQKAARLAPSDPAVSRARAMLHSRLASLADGGAAAAHWQEAIRLDGQREAYRLAFAQFLLNRRAEKKAETELRLAAAAFPKNPEFHRLLGLALYAQGRNEAAIDCFLRAIDLAPEEDTYYASLETLMPDAGMRAGAIGERLERFMKAHPGKPLGAYLLALLRPERAEALLKEAIATEPRFWPAYYELHKICWQRGDLAETIQLLEKVVELNSEYPAAHYKLGQVYAKIGNHERARREFELHHKLTTQSK